MAMIGSDHLSVLVGDGGAPTEVFTALKGVAITRLEISQRHHPSPAVANDAWQVNVGTSMRHAVIEGEAYGSDEAVCLRLRDLSLNGANGNFKLELSVNEVLELAAVVTVYREVIEAGNIKKIQFQLESSGVVSLA